MAVTIQPADLEATVNAADASHSSDQPVAPRTWKFYASAAGRQPIRDFLESLAEGDRAAVVQAMTDVARHGCREARHLRGSLYEVRARGNGTALRMLFGVAGGTLVALEGFVKKTQTTPADRIAVALQRLRQWSCQHTRTSVDVSLGGP